MKILKDKNIRFYFNKIKDWGISIFFYSVFAITMYIGYNIYQSIKPNDTLTVLKFASTILIPVSIFVTFISFKQNLILSKKTKALEEMDKIMESLQKSRFILDKNVDFVNRAKVGNPLTTEEIHRWICDKNENEQILRTDDGLCKMSERGKETKGALVNIINNYEKLGLGVYHNIFNENIAQDTFKLLVIQNYKLFEHYINHLRTAHHNTEAGVFFEWLYNRWK